MGKLTIKDLYRHTNDYENKSITIEGWVKTVRSSKTFGFIEINDGSFFKNIQIVFEETLSNFIEISKLSISSSIKVTGLFVKTEGAKQPFEIKASEIQIQNLASLDYPLQKKKTSFEYLRTVAHLRPRTNTFNAVFRVRSVLSYAIHKFFQERGFVYVHTPLITSSDAEGAGEMFNINSFDLANVPLNKDGTVDYTKDFFGKPAHLTVL
jgi:asparaginyl-tRNA synthetase